MYDSDFRYETLSGDSEVLDLVTEMSCPYPKVLMPAASVINAFYSKIWCADNPNQPYVFSTWVILARTVAGRHVCSYHFSRALVTVLVEVYGGRPGVQYQRYLPAFYEATDALASSGAASTQWIENAQVWLETFIKAAVGGYEPFMQLHSFSQSEVLRLRRSNGFFASA